MKPIIRVENLSKQYRIGAQQASYGTFRDTLTTALTAPFRRLRTAHHSSPITHHSDDTIWALKDINFEVMPGEVVGIIGRNGAGKSTLLKILSRITEPTTGKIDLHGRVSSLLEVGTGFHPELTGRENIYLNGAVLGMKRAEIARKFDEIVAFAEIEKFLDTPVKHYSSGMYTRLAFAVAAHLEPEILVVDEVLAVGDAAFQKKCLGKIKEIAHGGRTVLFVSHNLAAIRQMCSTGILLNSGEIKCKGMVSDCTTRYLSDVSQKGNLITRNIRHPHSYLQINSITICGSPLDCLQVPAGIKALQIDVTGTLKEPMRMELEAKLYDLYDTPLAFYSPAQEKGGSRLHAKGGFHLSEEIDIPAGIVSGEFNLTLALGEPGVQTWIEIPKAARLVFEGNPTNTGHVFDYYKGCGLLMLSGRSRL